MAGPAPSTWAPPQGAVEDDPAASAAQPAQHGVSTWAAPQGAQDGIAPATYGQQFGPPAPDTGWSMLPLANTWGEAALAPLRGDAVTAAQLLEAPGDVASGIYNLGSLGSNIIGRTPELWGGKRWWTSPYLDLGTAYGKALGLPQPSPDSATIANYGRNVISSLYGSILGGGALRLAPEGSPVERFGQTMANAPLRQAGIGVASSAAEQAMPESWSPELKGALTLGLGTGLGVGIPGMATTEAALNSRKAQLGVQMRDQENWPLSNLDIVSDPTTTLAAKLPFSGRTGELTGVDQAYTNSIASRINVAPEADGTFDMTKLQNAMDATGQRIGAFYLNNPLTLDPAGALQTTINRIRSDPFFLHDADIQGSALPRILDNIENTARAGGGVIPGAELQKLMQTKGGQLRVGAAGNKGPQFYQDLIQAVDQDLDTQVPAAAKQSWIDDRTQYKYQKSVQAAEDHGNVPPTALYNALERNKFVGPGDDLQAIAEAGQNYIEGKMPGQYRPWIKSAPFLPGLTGAGLLAGAASTALEHAPNILSHIADPTALGYGALASTGAAFAAALRKAVRQPGGPLPPPMSQVIPRQAITTPLRGLADE